MSDGNSGTFAQQFLAEAGEILARLDTASLERAAALLAETRAAGGRLFVLGVGGSAANASHAVNDFRKIAGLEAYAPTDNVSELTARVNDDGWASVFDSGCAAAACARAICCWCFPSAAAILKRTSVRIW